MKNIFIFIWLGMVVATATQARTIIVEPDNFANGINISTATQGVLLGTHFLLGSNQSGEPVYSPRTPVYAYETGDANYASTGTKVFGYYCGDCYYTTSGDDTQNSGNAVLGLIEPYWDNRNVFRAIFSASALSVAIDVINNNGFGQGTDIATMQVFGTTGLLATISSSTLRFPAHQKLEYQSAFSNITYIQLTSSEGSDFNLDQLQFQVPEPSALLLMAMGLLGYLSTRGKQGNTAYKCG
jgi:hypothetical protein